MSGSRSKRWAPFLNVRLLFAGVAVVQVGALALQYNTNFFSILCFRSSSRRAVQAQKCIVRNNRTMLWCSFVDREIFITVKSRTFYCILYNIYNLWIAELGFTVWCTITQELEHFNTNLNVGTRHARSSNRRTADTRGGSRPLRRISWPWCTFDFYHESLSISGFPSMQNKHHTMIGVCAVATSRVARRQSNAGENLHVYRQGRVSDLRGLLST